MFGIFDIDTYNIGTSQGLRCSGHLRCSNFARKSNFAKLAMFDFKRTIAKKAELRKIPRPSRSSNLRKGFLRLPACQSLSLWERWHGVSRDGEGKPVSREPPCSDGQALCQSDTIAVSELFGSILALSGADAPAPPKGEPLAGRATSYWTPEARYGAKGRALLQRAAASGQAHFVKLP